MIASAGSPTIALSICIATFRRADMIGETLRSIVSQLSADVELIVLDGASPDATATVVAAFAADNPAIRYVREDTNSGIDADFDKAVGYARGTHCWLFSDDDTLAPGAVAAVLAELAAADPDLVVVDAEVRDRDLNTVFEPRRLGFTARRTYTVDCADRMLGDLGSAMSFIGCVIVRRSMWLERNRRAYYGSLFVHVGVALQAPLQRVSALARPLVRIRIGNAMWTARGFQIWMFLWPDLIWSFQGFSNAARATVVPQYPWRQPQKLLVWRAYGVYTRNEYRAYLRSRVAVYDRAWMYLIAVLPGRATHALVVTLLTLRGHAQASSTYQLIEGSSFSNGVSRWIAGLGGYGASRHVTRD